MNRSRITLISLAATIVVGVLVLPYSCTVRCAGGCRTTGCESFFGYALPAAARSLLGIGPVVMLFLVATTVFVAVMQALSGRAGERGAVARR